MVTEQSTQVRKLSDEEFAAYQQKGYVVIDDLIPVEFIEQLKSRVREYTHEGRERGKIQFQQEPQVSAGQKSVEHPGDAVRKISCLVEHDDMFRQLGTHPNVVSIMEQLLGPDIKMFRNALLSKPAKVGSAKGLHQDSPYWPIMPMDLSSCWVALDDATMENGCLQVIDGGHMMGALHHEHVPDDFVIKDDKLKGQKLTPAPIPAGGAVIFHSLLPHFTAPNRSENSRRAITLSYMHARSRSIMSQCNEYLHIKGRSYPGCVQDMSL